MEQPAALFDDLTRALAEAGFAGDVSRDPALRNAMATDNSVYRIEPDLIVAPRDAEDVSRLLATLAHPRFRDIPVTGRGGGTGTNGQALNRGVIVDFRRHMTRILALDPAEGWVDVEPGIVLDDLNARIRDTGLFFAPNTSTSNRCTIGGMVSTDASGKGSRLFGKTSDNVLGLELALPCGRLDSALPPPAWAGAMLEAVRVACLRGRDPLLARVPRLPRRFTGYDLERAIAPDGSFEWWRLPIGAEGTLGLVTRVRLRLTRRPRCRMLVLLAFARFEEVLMASGRLLEADPAAIEVMDDWTTGLAAGAGLLAGLPDAMRGATGAPPVCAFVELLGEDAEALHAQAARIEAMARPLPGLQAIHVIADPAEIDALWSVRASAVGLLAGRNTGRRPISFVEDCVVPPARMAEFVRAFAAIMARHGLQYGIYGHADVGCLHTRPALDMNEARDREIYRTVSDEIYALTTRLGGIFWGEHGKGVRGAYLADFVGPEAYAAFRAVKGAFDPEARFNPGKLVAAPDALLPVAGTPLRPGPPPAGEEGFAPAFACNGNALCLSVAARTPICPSFKVSADLRHSPKGRAEALRAWELAGGAGAPADLAASVRAALDGCLGCKSCAVQCPASVDISEMKSRFLATYHASHPRPLGAKAAVWLERAAPMLARLRPLLRLGAAARLDRAAAAMAGLVDPPAASPRAPALPALSRQAAAEAGGPDDVLILPDPFTALFDTPALDAIAAGLATFGYRARLLPLVPGGKAAHVTGDRVRFAAMARDLAGLLRAAGASGRPIIAADPALTWMLRRDFAQAGIDDLPEVLTPEGFLAARIGAGRQPRGTPEPGPVRLFLHCTEQALDPASVGHWARIFAALARPVEIARTGCCGMSGLFGHEARHQDWSRALFDLSWRDQLGGAEVLATGFSCRCQVKRQAGCPAVHPFAVLGAPA
ncbi:MAG: FAD-binding and (Fe-S)-binding domain-containing protein [Tropicimonas sp.]|uniref:FAD-binding and (Fe-S)-binding domain-containing protein n=1 Tax=Tropicimonas sp. TaxID=2067044 RepID=UPI003A838F11